MFTESLGVEDKIFWVTNYKWHHHQDFFDKPLISHTCLECLVTVSVDIQSKKLKLLYTYKKYCPRMRMFLPSAQVLEIQYAWHLNQQFVWFLPHTFFLVKVHWNSAPIFFSQKHNSITDMTLLSAQVAAVKIYASSLTTTTPTTYPARRNILHSLY